MSHYPPRSPSKVPIRLRPSRLCPTNSRRGHQHGHLDPLPAAAMWAMTSRDGQQLVAIAVASPATIRTTGDLAAAVRGGCVPVALCPPACRLGLWASDLRSMTLRAGLACKRRWPPFPSCRSRVGGGRRRLALLAGLAQATAAVPGDDEPAANGRLFQRWRGRQAKHGCHGGHQQQPSWHRRPLLQRAAGAVTRPESPIEVSGGATPGWPAVGPRSGSHPTASLLVEPGVVEAYGQARSQPAAAAGDQHREQHGSGPGQTEDNQERSVPSHQGGAQANLPARHDRNGQPQQPRRAP
jgi:hypothetical protein